MDNTPDSPAKTPVGYTTQGGNFWTLITPEIWKVLHAVLHGYWAALLKWPQTANLLLPAERNLVLKASTVQGFMKINIEKEWRKLMEIKQLCEDEGFRKG